MRTWQFNEPHPLGKATITVTEKDIELNYYPYWKQQMLNAGRQDMINLEFCIEDFVAANWAREVF
jgi:hypothetical protein